MNVLKEFEDYYLKWASEEHLDQDSYEDKLRISGLPYCGLRHVYKRLIQLRSYSNMGRLYYTEVGTMVHTLTQYHLGMGSRILGDWECTDTPFCLGFRNFSTNNLCPACSRPMLYKELTLDLSKLFSYMSKALIDSVYVTKKGSYWVIDYKTSNNKSLELPPGISGMPYKSNVAQVKAYCALVELYYPIKIEGWALVYLARDNPLKSIKAMGAEISTKEKKDVLLTLKKYNEHYGKVMFCKDMNTIEELYKERPCKTEEYYRKHYSTYEGCPFSAYCFNKEHAIKELNRAWKYRPINFLSWNRPHGLKKCKEWQINEEQKL